MTETGHQHGRPGDHTALEDEAVTISEDGAAPVPPQRGVSRWWLLLALGGALAVGAAITVPVVSGGSPGATNSPAAYQVVTPPTAGGWKISASGSGGWTLDVVAASRLQILVDAKARHHVAAFYFDPGTGTNPDTNTSVIFTGASGSLGDPADLIARLRADPAQVTTLPHAVVTWHEVAPGPHGGRAACGDAKDPSLSPQAHVPFCVWQTTTTFGLLTQLITAPGHGLLTPDGLATLMRRIRPDLEATT